MKYCLDASIFVALWYETYTRKVTPSMYPALESRLPEKAIIIGPVYNEITPLRERKKTSDSETQGEKKDFSPIYEWVKDTLQIEKTPVGNDIEPEILRLQDRYQIIPNSLKGAGKTDITLIAYAKAHAHTVVTQENRQPKKPKNSSNYKIPLICKEEEVRCINLLEFLEELEISI